MPNFSAIRTNSANDPARIFRVTPLRWILTLNSVVPNLAAICFIKDTSHNKRQYFALALRQQVVPCTLFGNLSLALPICAVALDGLVNRIEQRLVAKRFSEKLNRTGLHRLHRHRDVAMASDKDDRNRKTGCSQLALEIESARSGQTHV
jgi:hypothetical protein